MQLRIMPSLREQFVMRSPLDDLSLRQHENAVRIPDGRKPVRHHEARAPREQLLQRVLDRPLGLRVHRAGGFVEDQDPGRATIARVNVSNCRSPALKFPPRSLTFVW